VKWQASPEVDEDLIEGRDFIRADNDVAARAFLNAAFETFDLLGDFPEMGPRVRLRSKKLRDRRFFVMPPPFSKWIVFYRVTDYGAGIARVLHGSMNWRQEPERFF
jgi:plasmid stabilization system protein ParE